MVTADSEDKAQINSNLSKPHIEDCDRNGDSYFRKFSNNKIKPWFPGELSESEYTIQDLV